MTGVRIDDDVVNWAVDGRSATAEAARAALADRPLLLLMHGYGSFEGDLIGLAPRLPVGFVCASPRAPLTAPPPVVNGYAWWPLRFAADGLVVREEPPAAFEGSGPCTASLAVLEWLDALDGRVAGGLGTIALLGFSQGGCMVTSLLRLRPERFACGVNCSGFVAPGATPLDTPLASVRPPLFWGRDPLDPIIGPERIAQTEAWAPGHTELDARLYAGIAHGIGAEELIDIAEFLRRTVPGADGAATDGSAAAGNAAEGAR